jgi:hypothetical protein
VLDVTIDIQGADVIVRGLEGLSVNFGRAMQPAIERSADAVRSYVSLYPPESEANLPRPGHTHYVRGTGSVYVRKRDGVQTVRKTSQMLNRKWSTKYRITANEAEAIIGNSANRYNVYVHDRRQQAKFHAARGWRTAQDTVEHLRERIRGFFEDAVKAALQQNRL